MWPCGDRDVGHVRSSNDILIGPGRHQASHLREPFTGGRDLRYPSSFCIGSLKLKIGTLQISSLLIIPPYLNNSQQQNITTYTHLLSDSEPRSTYQTLSSEGYLQKEHRTSKTEQKTASSTFASFVKFSSRRMNPSTDIEKKLAQLANSLEDPECSGPDSDSDSSSTYVKIESPDHTDTENSTIHVSNPLITDTEESTTHVSHRLMQTFEVIDDSEHRGDTLDLIRSQSNYHWDCIRVKLSAGDNPMAGLTDKYECSGVSLEVCNNWEKWMEEGVKLKQIWRDTILHPVLAKIAVLNWLEVGFRIARKFTDELAGCRSERVGVYDTARPVLVLFYPTTFHKTERTGLSVVDEKLEEDDYFPVPVGGRRFSYRYNPACPKDVLHFYETCWKNKLMLEKEREADGQWTFVDRD
ncbi:hypothetical protein BJ508DRAFT_338055 [Ascobolus immersus RN42]|uniref:Uncharacterized protein n=1 Tax=Ascobolus immersus RN42 TaxID=1160509 RepID=A0A3N4HVS3_ASCIM|nr:hypothetical protein BJ508DRAFT_338055 [Ascobolus immersus RN42]